MTLMSPPVGVTTAELADLVARLAMPATGLSEAEQVDRIAALQSLANAVDAAQARAAVALLDAREADLRAAGKPTDRAGISVGRQIALARRVSPHKGSRLLSLAHALVSELPETLAAMTRGDVGERAAAIVARESAHLPTLDRARIDMVIAARLGTIGERQLEAEVRSAVYAADPHGFVDKAALAVGERRVWLRPAPDAMAYLGALLPLQQAVAVYAALKRDADGAIATGDRTGAAEPSCGTPRSRGQVMADLLVERVTGQSRASAVPVEVQVVLTDTTLLAGSDAPAVVSGHGPIPAAVARAWIGDPEVTAWLRRLYASPLTGQLVAMDSRRRTFTGGPRRFITTRDQGCRTPFCNALIRHVDHVEPHCDGGETSIVNGAGECAHCNYTKDEPGWCSEATTDPGGRHTVTVTTPTGHTYQSSSPPVMPGMRPRAGTGPPLAGKDVRLGRAGPDPGGGDEAGADLAVIENHAVPAAVVPASTVTRESFDWTVHRVHWESIAS